MPYCVAFGCTNNDRKKDPNTTFHKFPKNEEMRQKWATAVKRKDWKPNNSSVLCSKHFKPEDFDRSSPFVTLVKRDVIPSIFPDCPEGYPETQIQIDPTKPKLRQNSDKGTEDSIALISDLDDTATLFGDVEDSAMLFDDVEDPVSLINGVKDLCTFSSITEYSPTTSILQSILQKNDSCQIESTVDLQATIQDLFDNCNLFETNDLSFFEEDKLLAELTTL